MAMCSDVYFWRQGLILLSDCIYCIGVGFFLAYPSLLNQAILSPDSTDLKTTPEHASWIAGSQGIGGLVGFMIVPTLMQRFGRKVAHYIMNSSVAGGFIIFYLATNIACLYAARLIQGLALTGSYITTIILSEYASPKRRGYYTSLKKGSIAFGSLLCHWIAIHCSWRQVALIGAVPNIISIFLTMLWPESPAFLAMKGQFEKCDKSHTWLKGNSPQSRRELEELISAQTERLGKKKERGVGNAWKVVTRKDFYHPFITSTLLTIVLQTVGSYYNFAYIVQIMNNIVKNDSVGVYYSLGSDLLTLIALLLSCYVIRKFNRRTILFSCGFLSVTLMFLVSLSIFLNDHNYIGSYFIWVAPCLILVNSFIINFGVISLCFTICGEIFPLEHRGLGTCITGIAFTTIYAVILKCTPVLIDYVGVHGTYGIYALISLTCLIILYFIVIETKDRTLQEIENEIKGLKVNNQLLLK